MRVLGLIPARGGSKGVPRKNLRPINGRPLVEYTVAAALQAATLARIVLSTDDEQIAEAGRRCGAEVPFLRPSDLATDGTPTLPVVQHALAWLADRGDVFDAVCILQPTTPLRLPADIDRCVERLQSSGADTVMTVVPVPVECNPHWVYFTLPDGTLRLSTGESAPIPRRQSLPDACRREGSVYVVTRETVIDHDTLFGARVIGEPIDPARCIDINTPDDWLRAELMLQSKSVTHHVRNRSLHL